ncbi:MAG: hypothetical protein H6707_01690 [Deltaproteobacteria bacterium]|nr:hypothetical protein [Deltaproteobacteria bacterium]
MTRSRCYSKTLCIAALLCAMAAPAYAELEIGMLNCHTDEQVARGNDALAGVLAALDAAPNLDVLIAPEWLFVKEIAGKVSMLSIAETNAVLDTLAAKTKGRDTLVVPGTIAVSDGTHYFNRLPVLHNGEQLLTYDKQSDGGDDAFARKNGLSWRAGERRGVFRWRGMNVGVEICADHSSAKLKYALRGKETVDMHILISSGLGRYNPSVATTDGLFLQCDGYYPHQEVLSIKGSRQTAISPQRKAISLCPKISLTRFTVPGSDFVGKAERLSARATR